MRREREQIQGADTEFRYSKHLVNGSYFNICQRTTERTCSVLKLVVVKTDPGPSEESRVKKRKIRRYIASEFVSH